MHSASEIGFQYLRCELYATAIDNLFVEPVNMRSYLLDNEVGLEDVQREKLQVKVDALLAGSERRGMQESLMKSYFSQTPDIESGFKSFDFEKFSLVLLKEMM